MVGRGIDEANMRGGLLGQLSVTLVFLGLATFPSLYWRAHRRRPHQDVLVRTFGPGANQ